MKGEEEKEEQSAGWSHCNASHARQFVAALVPCPLPYLPARSEGALARVARRIDLPPAHEETAAAAGPREMAVLVTPTLPILPPPPPAMPPVVVVVPSVPSAQYMKDMIGKIRSCSIGW